MVLFVYLKECNQCNSKSYIYRCNNFIAKIKFIGASWLIWFDLIQLLDLLGGSKHIVRPHFIILVKTTSTVAKEQKCSTSSSFGPKFCTSWENLAPAGWHSIYHTICDNVPEWIGWRKSKCLLDIWARIFLNVYLRLQSNVYIKLRECFVPALLQCDLK